MTVGSYIIADVNKKNSSSSGEEQQHSGVSIAAWLEQGTAGTSSSVSQQKAKSASSFSFHKVGIAHQHCNSMHLMVYMIRVTDVRAPRRRKKRGR